MLFIGPMAVTFRFESGVGGDGWAEASAWYLCGQDCKAAWINSAPQTQAQVFLKVSAVSEVVQSALLDVEQLQALL